MNSCFSISTHAMSLIFCVLSLSLKKMCFAWHPSMTTVPSPCSYFSKLLWHGQLTTCPNVHTVRLNEVLTNKAFTQKFSRACCNKYCTILLPHIKTNRCILSYCVWVFTHFMTVFMWNVFGIHIKRCCLQASLPPTLSTRCLALLATWRIGLHVFQMGCASGEFQQFCCPSFHQCL